MIILLVVAVIGLSQRGCPNGENTEEETVKQNFEPSISPFETSGPEETEKKVLEPTEETQTPSPAETPAVNTQPPAETPAAEAQKETDVPYSPTPEAAKIPEAAVPFVTEAPLAEPSDPPASEETARHEHDWRAVVSVIHHEAITHVERHEAVTHTVHHDAVYEDVTVLKTPGYEETVVVQDAWDETVIVSPAWDEEIRETHVFCGACGMDLTANGISGGPEEDAHMTAHILNGESSRTYTDTVVTGTLRHEAQTSVVHHDAVTETIRHEPEYVTEKRLVSAAYDETVTDREAYEETVIDVPAWDEEVITGYVCSICGSKK